jgi:hypothetical protein
MNRAPKASKEDNKASASMNQASGDPDTSSNMPPPPQVDHADVAHRLSTPLVSPKNTFDIDRDEFAPTPETVATYLCEKMDINTAIFTQPTTHADKLRPYRHLNGRTVMWDSMFRLESGEFLNDEIIGFYFMLLQEREYKAAQQENRTVKVLFLDTQFTREFSGTDIYINECNKVNRRLDKMQKRYGVSILMWIPWFLQSTTIQGNTTLVLWYTTMTESGYILLTPSTMRTIITYICS